MKKIIAFLLTALMATSMVACGSKQTVDTSLDDVINKGEITVAISPDFAPNEFKDPNTGEIMGSDIYIAQYVADYLSKKYDKEINLKIEEMDFKTCQAAVQAGSVDFHLTATQQQMIERPTSISQVSTAKQKQVTQATKAF